MINYDEINFNNNLLSNSAKEGIFRESVQEWYRKIDEGIESKEFYYKYLYETLKGQNKVQLTLMKNYIDMYMIYTGKIEDFYQEFIDFIFNNNSYSTISIHNAMTTFILNRTDLEKSMKSMQKKQVLSNNEKRKFLTDQLRLYQEANEFISKILLFIIILDEKSNGNKITSKFLKKYSTFNSKIEYVKKNLLNYNFVLTGVNKTIRNASSHLEYRADGESAKIIIMKNGKNIEEINYENFAYSNMYIYNNISGFMLANNYLFLCTLDLKSAKKIYGILEKSVI